MLLQYHNRMGSPLYYSPTSRDTRTSAHWGAPHPGFTPYPGMMANFTEEMQLPVSPQDYNNCTNDSDEEGAMCIVSEERKIDTEEDISVDDDGAENFICKWNGCDRLFDSPDNLAQHVTVNHATASRSGQYYCCWDGCPRAQRGFNARYKMLVHVRTHTKEKPHKCSVCGKRFSRTENLKIHARSHSGERPYVCPVLGCNKAYSNSSDRFKHTRTHSTDRPYVCKIPGCLKRYTDPSSLRKHVKTFKHHTILEKDEKLHQLDIQNQKTDSYQLTSNIQSNSDTEVINKKINLEAGHISKDTYNIDINKDKTEKDRNCNCTHECFEHIQKASEFFKIGALLNNFASGRTFFNNDIINSGEFQNLAWGKLWSPLITPDFIKNNISTNVVEKQIPSEFKLEKGLLNETMDVDVPLDLTMHK